MKIGVADAGGGVRGAYGAGVFDALLEEGIGFDYHIGVSAGSANIASFLAGQKGRSLRFYTVFAKRSLYMGRESLLACGSYLNLEYIYGDGLSNRCGEYPLDFEAIQAALASGKEYKIVATDAASGESVYYDGADMAQDDYGAIKGSSCVPLAAGPYEWKGRLLYDGGLTDPIPFQRALEDGCDRLVIILTRPRDFRRSPDKDRIAAKLLRHPYPKAAKALANRAYTYNHELDLALKLEAKGKALILAPYRIDGISILSPDPARIRWLYELGREDAGRIRPFLER